jgi:hypothetical protein
VNVAVKEKRCWGARSLGSSQGTNGKAIFEAS